MNDLDWASAFLGRFALPLVSGGQASVGVPLLQKGTERLLKAVTTGLDATTIGVALSKARQRQLAELGIISDTPLLATDRESIRLLCALHDALFLFHPRGRELATSRRAGLLQQVRRQLVTAAEALPEPDVAAARSGLALTMLLERHSLLAGLWPLRPAMTQRPVTGSPSTIETEVLAVPIDADERPLLRYLGMASPLLLLLRPPPGALQLIELLPWLQISQVARLFVTTQLRHGTALAISRISTAVSQVLDYARSGTEPLPSGHLLTLLTVHSLFHLRAAISEGTPPMGDDLLRDALALYATVNQGWPSLAMPQDVRSDKQMAHQVVRYQQACIELAGSERLRTMHQRWASLFPGS